MRARSLLCCWQFEPGRLWEDAELGRFQALVIVQMGDLQRMRLLSTGTVPHAARTRADQEITERKALEIRVIPVESRRGFQSVQPKTVFVIVLRRPDVDIASKFQNSSRA
ncbi:hypothetical protein J3458_003115 [Metarhizium acridum]|uniref:uncharacterized protein n=1 Tax=Metarhizium acridum TaxID=92637 RepID=UPI001C6C3B4B|nr:hypothetical protein J3458_003115 [Metarhizium acridum]